MNKPMIRRRTMAGGKPYWFLTIPAINYSGGWESWVVCMMALRLHYRNPTVAALNPLINAWRNSLTYDGHFQFTRADWDWLHRHAKREVMA